MMRLRGSAMLTVGLALLVSCGEPVSDEHVVDQPATVEELPGSELSTITLTEPAAERLDIQTVAVASSEDGLVVPSSAIYLDAGGQWWVYTNPEPSVFVRAPIQIVSEEGGEVRLSEGPPVGTQVVVVGVPELYGTEVGIGR
ncbi:MAG: hypothetical protein WD096_10655 [Actinomycetota bacterium]